jgi:hypothetical protein
MPDLTLPVPDAASHFRLAARMFLGGATAFLALRDCGERS